MLYPSIVDLRKKADSRYSLVIMASKRARELVDGKLPLVDVTECKNSRELNQEKTVSIAIEEISEGLLTYEKAGKDASKEKEEL